MSELELTHCENLAQMISKEIGGLFYISSNPNPDFCLIGESVIIKNVQESELREFYREVAK